MYQSIMFSDRRNYQAASVYTQTMIKDYHLI